jgi:hypothetical protein
MPEEASNDGNRQNDTCLENDDNHRKNDANSPRNDICHENDKNHLKNNENRLGNDENRLGNDDNHNKNDDNHNKNDERRHKIKVITLKILSKDLRARQCLLEKNLKKMLLAGFEGPLALPDLQFRCKNNKIVLAHKIAFALVSSSFLKKIII